MSKEELIKQICKLQPSYTFGDNAEQLWNEDEEELEELLEKYAKSGWFAEPNVLNKFLKEKYK